MDNSTKLNRDKNKKHYEKVYANYSIDNILRWLNDLDSFMNNSQATDTSWHALYQENLKNRLKDKKVLEMGCGDCVNAAVMAGLGAKVYSNDIANASGVIIEKLNTAYKFKYPIEFIEGDFLQNNLKANQFDFIIGKAFLHHLTIPEEKQFLEETSRLLNKEGEARFFEPAVNSKVLDELRWIIPVKGRPSKLNKIKFNKWKESDPHPDRSFSSQHFLKAGKEFFNEAYILPVGTLERFNRILPRGNFNFRFRRLALKAEKKLPLFLNVYLTRSQLIVYKKPIR